MKYLTSLLSIIFITESQSQELLDRSYLQCQYKYIWQFDTLKNVVRDDLLILQIGSNLSKCYSYYTSQSDSLDAAPDGKNKRRILTKKAVKDYLNLGIFEGIPYKRMKTYVYKNYPKGKMTVTDGISTQYYRYEDKLHAQNWQISDSTKTVLDYLCQMAECDFRGRQWTAWFAADIPVSDGPWKFGGLPGLIMEVYDKGSQYHFTIIGLERRKDIPIVFTYFTDRGKYEQTTRNTFLKTEKRYLMDLSSYIEMETGIDLSGGYPQNVMRYDLIERDYK
ncbi:GLPGLI family protein [Limibacterium fermenti]|jgi:GLPGLI family protein|uniref:GLPGLI family protein n=1 Tax=Limibacterium fermenti TaxID=3229863 RepID=UPI003A77529C